MPSELDWSEAHFLIDCVGMADRWMWSFEVDETWFVLHGTPGAGLVPFRLDGTGPASLEEVLFIADCVAFDHDTPTVVRPSATTPAADLPLIDPVVPFRGEQGGLRYFDALAEALLMATEIRVGEPVELRYTDDRPDLLNFSSRFADLEEPLSLYAMATRQVDFLSEYLCLYRVLEWVNKDNGVSFTEERLQALGEYEFGSLWAQPSFQAMSSTNPVDVFETYQHRATSRFADLRKEGRNDREISEHLYGVRNALAHGKREFLRSDFSSDVKAVAEDLPIVKLLARMAVEEGSRAGK